MTFEQLQHAIRAACQVADDTEVLIFGSQAILGSYPEAPEDLRTSIEVDIQPKNRPENTNLVDGALGQDSQFHATFGFYVHGVSIEAAILPDGWSERTIRVPERSTGFVGECLEPHDLAASKLVAFREKDRVFVTTLLSEGLLDGRTLLGRIRSLPGPEDRRNRLVRWAEKTVAGLSQDA